MLKHSKQMYTHPSIQHVCGNVESAMGKEDEQKKYGKNHILNALYYMDHDTIPNGTETAVERQSQPHKNGEYTHAAHTTLNFGIMLIALQIETSTLYAW